MFVNFGRILILQVIAEVRKSIIAKSCERAKARGCAVSGIWMKNGGIMAAVTPEERRMVSAGDDCVVRVSPPVAHELMSALDVGPSQGLNLLIPRLWLKMNG